MEFSSTVFKGIVLLLKLCFKKLQNLKEKNIISFFKKKSKCKNDEMNAKTIIDLDDLKYHLTNDYQFNSTKIDSQNMKTMRSPTFPLVKSPSQDSFESAEANVDVADYTEPKKIYENENYY